MKKKDKEYVIAESDFSKKGWASKIGIGGGTQLAAYISNKWKYIINETTREEELYDMEKDPKELNDLSKDNKKLCSKFKKAIQDERGRKKESNELTKAIGDVKL